MGAARDIIDLVDSDDDDDDEAAQNSIPPNRTYDGVGFYFNRVAIDADDADLGGQAERLITFTQFFEPPHRDPPDIEFALLTTFVLDMHWLQSQLKQEGLYRRIRCLRVVADAGQKATMSTSLAPLTPEQEEQSYVPPVPPPAETSWRDAPPPKLAAASSSSSSASESLRASEESDVQAATACIDHDAGVNYGDPSCKIPTLGVDLLDVFRRRSGKPLLYPVQDST
jgi:hypothetical protein